MIRYKAWARSFILLLILLSLTKEYLHCQQKLTMIVGGVELSLGMKKDEVLKKLENLKLNDVGNDAWMILRKNLQTDEFETVGFIQFIKGRLYSASRDWVKSQQESEVEDFGELFSALSSVTSKSGTDAVIQTYELVQPGMSSKNIVIHVGDRSFSIIIHSDSELKLKQVQIDERIVQE